MWNREVNNKITLHKIIKRQVWLAFVMKNAAVQNRMTRIQVQEKFKKNFQALCAQCPQLAKNHDTLDDSLTSLQWLWNLNVNISNPTDQFDNNNLVQRSNSLLPSLPRSLSDVDKNSSSIPQVPLKHQGLSASPKSNSDENGTNQPLNIKNLTAHLSNGAIRALPKNGRKTSVQIIRRPSPPVSHNQRYARYNNSTHSIRFKKDQDQSSPVSKSRTNSEGSNRKSENSLNLNTTVPEIRIVNLAKVHDDSSTSDKSPPRHYSFSPREAMLDVLPGQVDYKNNPYVKPTFSFITLICMALQSSKNHRLSCQGVCKWITDNFMYYRYADSGWQNSVKTNLTQSKYFNKVHKKKDSANCLYELGRDYDLKLRDANSPLLNGNQQGLSPRLEPISNHISPVSSLSVPSLSSLLKLEQDDPFNNRKRKQTTPQKLIRRRHGAAKKRKNSNRNSEVHNLLQEEAPELGSLKGDFNWNTIFDEFFGAADVDLSATSTSLASRVSINDGSDGHQAVGRFSDDVVSGSLLAHDILLTPESESEKVTASKAIDKTLTWRSPNDCILHPANGRNHSVDKSNAASLPKECNTNVCEASHDLDHDSIGCFFNEIPQLDLNLTEPPVESTTSWDFLGPDLDEILREKPEENRLDPVRPSEEIDRLFSSSSDNLSVPGCKSDVSVPL